MRPFPSSAFLASALLALALPPGSAFAKSPIFELADPAGDDHGNGNLVYPLRSDLQQGDLDLVAFRAFDDQNGTLFEVELARRVRRPERGAIDEAGTDLLTVARHGFYNFSVDVYIDTDRQPGSGGVAMLPGREAEVDQGYAWERAVVLSPRPAETRSALRRMWLRELNEAMREQLDGPAGDDRSAEDRRADQVRATLAESVFFPNQIRVAGRIVRFFVPDAFLGGRASKDWAYTVVITGTDLSTSLDLAARAGIGQSVADDLMTIPISPGTWKDRFGGGREAAPNQPPIVDLLVPAGKSQERILSEFTSAGEDPQPVRVPGIVPAAALAH
jgi:hypothetical protein